MNYKHRSQIERYQIASLMKAQHSITQIASLVGRDKSTISRELRRNDGSRGYRPKQASELAVECSEQSRNAYTVAPALNSTGYFARPFASWERGSDENFNGLLRQYVPKKRPIKYINDEEIKMIENRLNNRPRKRLGFKTPAEVSHQSQSRVALRH
jgi:IS30 family transposase